MIRNLRAWMLLLLAAVLLTSCSRPQEDPHDHDHTHPWDTQSPSESTGSNQTPVTGSVSGFSVWDAGNHTANSAVAKEPTLRVIDSIEKWETYSNAYYPDLKTKYDSAFFQNHSLVIYRREEMSSSTDLDVVDVLIKQEKLVLVIRRHEPFLQDQNMKSWCLFVEVEGTVAVNEDSDVAVEFLKSNS